MIKRALYHNKAAMIVAHNHPSGVAEPSESDKDITQWLKKALALVDVNLLDHLVIGDNRAVSLAERGFLIRASVDKYSFSVIKFKNDIYFRNDTMNEYRTKLGEDGRIIIPAACRRQLHLETWRRINYSGRK